jgi:hypothetical protein
MIKIKNRYTVRVTYAGINQYLHFNENEDGKILKTFLSISYLKKEDADKISHIKELTNIDDIISELKKSGIFRNVDLHLINGKPLFLTDKQIEYSKEFSNKFDEFLNQEGDKYFRNVIEPFIKENKIVFSYSHIGMPIPAEYGEDGELQNISNRQEEFEFQYLCYLFLRNFSEIEINFKSEFNAIPSLNCYSSYTRYVSDELIAKYRIDD